LEYADRGVYVLARTSNRSGNDLQDTHTPQAPLYQVVVQQAAMWGAEARHEGRGAVGLVVGATHPGDLAKIRGWTSHLPFLIPGIGAQGGSIEAAAGYGEAADGTGPLINSSRGIIFASSRADFAEAARAEAESLREAISSARQEAAS
jgi:orotidine-5'-phosphate decarboxylase